MEDTDQKRLLLEDKKMAAAAARGDREAFTALIERYRRYMYSVAYRIALNEDDALDITQNVLLRLVSKIGQYNGRGAFRSWLATITSNEAMSFLRRAVRKRERAFDPVDLDAVAASEGLSSKIHSPRRAADLEQERELVEKAMSGLSTQQRAIFALRFREEMPPREISERLGLPPGQVRSQLHRAIARLRDIVAEKRN